MNLWMSSREKAARHDVAARTAPLLFGRFMDGGMSSAVLYGAALSQGIAAVAALGVGQARVAETTGPAIP
jgi:hypothetical protein